MSVWGMVSMVSSWLVYYYFYCQIVKTVMVTWGAASSILILGLEAVVGLQFADVKRNLMYEVLHTAPGELGRHLDIVVARQDQATGAELSIYGPHMCGEGTSFDVFTARCQRCSTLPCTPEQPPSSWLASKADDATWYRVCGDNLAWDYASAASQPQCLRARTDNLIAFRPAQITSDFVVQISETYCPYCKPSYTAVLRHSATHPDFVMFEVDVGPKGRYDATALTVKGFKMPASACNKPMYVVPADAARYTAMTSTTYLPNVFQVNASHAMRQSAGAWRDTNPTDMPFAALWGPTNASISFDECLDEGERLRAPAMRAYYGASTCAHVRVAASDARVAHRPCCRDDAATCSPEEDFFEIPTASDSVIRVVRSDTECESIDGGTDLDVIECERAFLTPGIAPTTILRMETSSRLVSVLQTQPNWDTLMPRDTRKCFIEESSSTIAFKSFSLTNADRLCKICRDATDNTETSVDVVVADVITRRNSESLRRRVTEECECGDAHCRVDESCASDTVVLDGNASRPLCWRRPAPHLCESYTSCDVNVDEYECEFMFRRHFHDAVKLGTRLIVDTRSVNRSTYADEKDTRACYFDNRADLGYFRTPPPTLFAGDAVYACRSDVACDTLMAPPPSPPLANCSDAPQAGTGTWVGNGDYGGDCASYVMEELDAGLGNPCDKTLQQIIDDWAPVFTFTPLPAFDVTSLFRDVCCATCNAT